MCKLIFLRPIQFELAVSSLTGVTLKALLELSRHIVWAANEHLCAVS